MIFDKHSVTIFRKGCVKVKITIDSKTLFQILPIIATFLNIGLTVFLTFHMFKKEPTKTYIKERYEKVIFPVYEIFEKHFYSKNVDKEISKAYQACKSLIEKNRVLSGGKLYYVFLQPLSKDHIITVSTLLISEYDKSCKQLGIPPLDFSYKMSLLKKAPNHILIKIRHILKQYIPLILFVIILYLVIFIVKAVCAIQVEFV